MECEEKVVTIVVLKIAVVVVGSLQISMQLISFSEAMAVFLVSFYCKVEYIYI